MTDKPLCLREELGRGDRIHEAEPSWPRMGGHDTSGAW